MNQQVAEFVGEKVLENLKREEDQLDSELDRLKNLDEDDLDKIRERRLYQMKQRASKMSEWKSKGHGEYTELSDQQDFFQTTKGSKHVIVHFYSPTNTYGPIVDKHFQQLASRHLETKFCKINAEKSEYLVRKLGVWMMPTILLCRDREVIHQISGFDELGGTEKFSTLFLEYVLGSYEVLKYDGPPPESVIEDDKNDRLNLTRHEKSNVRQSVFYDSDLDEE